MKQIIYTNKQGYSETHIFDNSGSIVSVLNSDAYQQVSLSVTPEKTNEVVNYIAFAFVYGYNENEMTVDNAEVNISPLIQSSEDSKNETSEKEAVDEEVLSESIDKSKPYMQTSSEYDNTGNYVTSETNEQGSTTKYSYDEIGNPLTYRDGMSMTWKNGRQLATLTNGDTSISYGYDSDSVRTTKTVNGVKYTYAYLNGQLMYETRGDAKFYYSYDANGILYNVRYTLTDGGTEYSYYYTHNSRGDIVGIYNGAGELKAHYEYDAWGNVISITDNNGNAITNPNHIGNLNPFRYRGYYYDTESGFYYLMSRYYDPVTHRFINADGYFQSGGNILDANMHSYCGNNPIMFADPTGLCYEPQYTSARTYIGKYWVIKTAVPGVPGFCNSCKSNGSNSGNKYYVESNKYYVESSKNNKNTKGDSNWTTRKDSKKGSENRQKSGDRERNVAHPNGEEHSRVPKGNGVKHLTETPFEERMGNFGICLACAVAVIYLVGNDVTGAGVADDVALVPTIALLWDSASKAFG